MTNIKDIAQHCHVGVSTVSRVLNGHPDVSDATRERVMQAIAEFRYIPNNSARNLVRTTSDTVALIVRGVGNPFFSSIVKVLEQELYRHGYTMALHQIGTDDDEVNTAALLVKEKNLRGVVFLGGRFNYTAQELALIGVPYVCCTYSNAFGDLSPAAYSSVAVDDKKEAARAVAYLIGKGHRRIAALISHEKDHSISELRYEGYRTALAAAGLVFEEALVARAGSFEMGDAYLATERLARSGAGFTALFAISDTMAIAAMKALHAAGRRVPEDCSVIAIDGLESSRYTIPTLTTLVQPSDRMAYESAAILKDLMEGRAKNRHIVMETVLREGESVREPGAGSW